jgi:hypothetical protein
MVGQLSGSYPPQYPKKRSDAALGRIVGLSGVESQLRHRETNATLLRPAASFPGEQEMPRIRRPLGCNRMSVLLRFNRFGTYFSRVMKADSKAHRDVMLHFSGEAHFYAGLPYPTFGGRA